MRILVLFLFATAASGDELTFRLEPNKAKLTSPAVTEASGLAASPSTDGFLWMINDSGSAPEIHLSQTDGKSRGAVKVENASNTDWEDIAAFSKGTENFLLIADTGDNNAARKSVTLLIVREPKLPAEGETLSATIPIEWIIEFTYEDGPRDCEAVAVDSQNEKVILISKRTDTPIVYELPLKAAKNAIARKIGTTETKSPRPISIPFTNQPTGLDISSDNLMAVVVTYHGVFLFKRLQEESWSKAFAKKPEFLGAHNLLQAEAVAFARDRMSIFAISEKTNSPIVRYTVGD